MGKWYIDRSRNVSSIVSSIHFELLKRLIDNDVDYFDPNELIDKLQIDGANKNALLTNFRDLGLIDDNNKPSQFFIACTKAMLPVSYIVLLILIKRNDEKKERNDLKPFIVLSKALSEMIDNDCAPELTWELCDNYLMKVSSYEDITWEKLFRELKKKTRVLNTPVLDIWFNALIATDMFDGDKKHVILKKEYYSFIQFLAKHGADMLPSHNREEYLNQACDSKYGWYDLFKAYTYEGVCSINNLPLLINYVQSVDSLDNKTVVIKPKAEYKGLGKDDLEKELKLLTQQQKELQERIVKIETQLELLKENESFLTIKTNSANENLFSFFLHNNKELAEHTISSYFQSLRKMKDLLFEYEKILINTEIYFIADIVSLEMLINRFEQNRDLVEINRHFHNSISAAYNNYHEFLKTMGEIG